MLSLAHGADGLCWFIYNSRIDSNKTTHKPAFYTIGMLDPEDGFSNRDTNCYGQNKWQYVSQMNGKILKWTKVLDNSNWVDGFSVHQDNASHHYISDIKSYQRTPFVFSESDIDLDNIYYWEEGFYEPKEPADKSKYFIMVNRRCVPETDPGVGDIRRLKIKFTVSDLSGFNNWIIKDVNTGREVTFDKNNQGTGGYLNLGSDTNDIGYFLPGEGKLFKLAPVMQEGGTLAGDESVSGSFNCNGKVNNNSKNITITQNTTITFDTLAGIEMNGGSFTCGDNSSSNINISLKGKDNNAKPWNGLSLSNCSSIGIYNTSISKITANDTAKAVLISNCNNINIIRSIFNMGSNAGAIQAVFTSNSEENITFNVSECNFVMGMSGYDAISITSNASNTLPVIVDWCNFNTENGNSFALRLIGVTGGAIKNSTFVNYETAINSMSSAIDLYGNVIIGNNDSKGIECSAVSEISLSPASGLYLGGYNYINNNGSSSSNIYSINSNFNIDAGQNDFDLSDIDNSKHLTGTLYGDELYSVYATKNCFHKDSITNIDATHSVVWDGTTDPVNFIFTDYSCKLSRPGDYIVYQ